MIPQVNGANLESAAAIKNTRYMLLIRCIGQNAGYLNSIWRMSVKLSSR